MKRLLLTLLSGCVAGVACYQAYLHARAPRDDGGLAGQLAWMQSELGLTKEQFTRIEALHHDSRTRLREMAGEVAQMKVEFAEFERTRRTADRVDFIEFARFVENRRRLNEDCRDSTRRLVQASAEVMTPQQRQRYFNLISTTEPLVGALLR